MGGFVDGIVLHQILQWHNMLSAKVPPVDLVSSKVNMLWDGIFHGVVWLITAWGIVCLWRATTRANLAGLGRPLFGSALLGWALFNIVEGIIDHHILGLHHVREFVIDKAPWDWGFLIGSVVLGVIGLAMMRRTEP